MSCGSIEGSHVQVCGPRLHCLTVQLLFCRRRLGGHARGGGILVDGWIQEVVEQLVELCGVEVPTVLVPPPDVGVLGVTPLGGHQRPAQGQQ